MKSERRLLVWLALLGFAAILFVCAASTAVWFFVGEREGHEPRAAANSYLLDVRARRRGDALRRMVPSYQLAYNATTFDNALDHAPALALHTGSEIEDVQVDDDVATVEASLSGPSGRSTARFELRLLDGHWYIERVLIDD